MLKIQEATHSQYTPQIINFISSTPWFTSTQFHNEAKIPRPSSSRLLSTLAKSKIIRQAEAGKGRRPSLFEFPDLLEEIS